MRLEAVRVRAARANAAALEAEKAKDAVEAEMEALKSLLGAKKARREPAQEEEGDAPRAPVGNWDLADHRREMSRVQTRSTQLEIGSRSEASAHTPRTGQFGFLLHPRHGLLGALRYWARGVKAYAAHMVVSLVKAD